MKTIELIRRLLLVDPDGTKEVALNVGGSGFIEDIKINAPDNADWIELEE